MDNGASEVSHTDDEPLGESRRLAALDVLRGFAVLAIVLPNIVAFGQPLEASFSPSLFLTDPGPGADYLWVLQFILVDGKMRGLFELLFGAGIALFVERSWARGATRLLQARRLLILAAFGMAHGVFLWGGDILWSYGIVGLALLPFLELSALRLAVLGGVTAVFGAAFYAATMLPLALAAADPHPDGVMAQQLAAELRLEERAVIADGVIEAKLIRAGDYPGFVAHNWTVHVTSPFEDALYASFELFPLMLIGAALYRAGLFSGRDPTPGQRRLAWGALTAGGVMSTAIALDTLRQGLSFWATSAAAGGWATGPIILMTVGMTVLLTPVAARGQWRVAGLLAGAGRTAFSNYIGTSLVMLFVFHGFGLGLFGQLNRIELYAILPPLWLAMLAWPQFWLSRFRYGPLEWLWRSLTYGKVMPLRR